MADLGIDTGGTFTDFVLGKSGASTKRKGNAGMRMTLRTRELIIVFVLAISVAIAGCNEQIVAKAMGNDTIKNASNSKEEKNTVGLPKAIEYYANSSTGSSFENDITGVSIIQLIANPEKFNGKYVRLIGFVRLEFEGDAIYLHKEDYERGLTKNGLWLEITGDCCGDNTQGFDQKYCLVQGTFNAENRGHMDLFSGSIENIKRIKTWPPDIVKKIRGQN